MAGPVFNGGASIDGHVKSAGWVSGDVLGLRLDVTRGALTGFKNGKRLGVRVRDDALRHQSFCWVVEVRRLHTQVVIARRAASSTRDEEKAERAEAAAR